MDNLEIKFPFFLLILNNSCIFAKESKESLNFSDYDRDD